MTRKGISTMAWLAVVLAFPSAMAEDRSKTASKPCVKKQSYCRSCHMGSNVASKLKDLTLSCDKYCGKCHAELKGHHAVGVKVKNTNLSQLRFVAGDRLGCISCHDLGRKRYDSRCWKSQSLFARLFASSKRYKTYYLRVNNSKGALCKKCH